LIPQLLFDIAKCKNFCKLIGTTPVNHPCSEIIDFQKTKGIVNKNDYQLPEPWSGDINAPILFLSSNPSFSAKELYPTLSWSEPMIADFFINRFKNRGAKYSWVFENKVLNKNGSRGRKVQYWTRINNRAEEIMKRTAVIGKDYCLTEIVHCKSNKEKYGVKNALPECTLMFLNDLINLRRAKIIVAVGAHVKRYLGGVTTFNGVEVIYIPHTASRGRVIPISELYSQDQIERIRKKILDLKIDLKPINYSDFKLPTEEEVTKFIDGQLQNFKNN
jgi:hypothetical protein